MSPSGVKEKFESVVHAYDEVAGDIIPYFTQQHAVISAFLNFPKIKPLKILDLGIGSGSLTEIILTRFPQAHVTGMDVSKSILEQCQKRFLNYQDRLKLIHSNITEFSFKNHYDLIFAGFSLHHLSTPQKKKAFEKIANATKLDGIFIMRDIVKGATKEFTALYEKAWYNFIKSNKKDADDFLENHKKHNQPETVEAQMAWLKEYGFQSTDCPWKYFNFAVIVAKK